MRRRTIGLAILECAIAFGLAGCGGSSAPTALVVTLSPPSASIAVNSSVQISLQNPALPKYTSSIDWNIQEYGSSTSCVEVSTGLPSDAPPLPNCPFGYLALTYPSTGYPSLYGGYFAPSAPTTAHVVATVKIYTDIHQSAIKSEGSATSVVTVTSQ
ncbi:MAG: hypothetical protein WBM04_05255 [Candidatus Korobacteraceae bacterium]